MFGVKPGVVENGKDPLGPTEILDVRSGDLAIPVVTETEHLQLAAEGLDVAFGADPRMLASLDRVVLSGQAERVESHRVQNRDASHSFVTANDVGRGVALRVANV